MRLLDWPERLAETIEAAQERAYGPDYYCATFAADCVMSVTGLDPMAGYRELTREQAEAKLEAEHGTLEAALEARFGPGKPVAMAQRGDVILRRDDDGAALGICLGVDSAFISSAGGLAIYRTLECAAAFTV